MSKYTYVLKADRPKYRDGSGWLNLDVSVTVVAEDYEAATEEALRILSKPPDRFGWSFWTQSIAPYEEPHPDLIQLGNEALRLLSRVVVKAETVTPAQQAAVAIHNAPPVPRDYSGYDTQGFIDIYIDGPTWDSEREEYWAVCDVCDTGTYNGHENVTEDWMIDHANAHIGGTI